MNANLQFHQLDAKMQQCIQNCLDCHSICLNTITYCLQQGGQHAEMAHIVLMQDCVEICQTSANFMLKNSPLHGRTCDVCAEVCERCGRDCDRFPEDFQMQFCAEICRRCAETCREMARETVVV